MAPSPQDSADRRLTLSLFIALFIAVLAIGAIAWFVFGPALAAAFAPGIGLQTAALIAGALALVLIVVMALVAGDGLLGELPAMIAGFIAFFVIAWLMIAWIF